jgi:3D (Asp-Asp-Asp) domain-containing protein
MPNSAIAIPTQWAYTPNAQKADPLALDTAILASSPWAYWKLNEASGLPQDSSGNGRHSTYAGAALVRQHPARTSKTGPSIFFNGTTASILFPTPQAHLSALSGTWTIMGMFEFSWELGIGSGAANAYGSVFLAQDTGSANAGTNYDFHLRYARTYGECLTLFSTSGYIAGSASGMQLSQPMVITVVGTSIPGVSYSFDVWINGVKNISGPMRGNATATANGLTLGRINDQTYPYPAFWASNIAMWAYELNNRQIMDLTEYYMDKPKYATLYKP